MAYCSSYRIMHTRVAWRGVALRSHMTHTRCQQGSVVWVSPREVRPSAPPAVAGVIIGYDLREPCPGLVRDDEIQDSELKNRSHLGKGNFGLVERANWRGTAVAIKTFKPPRTRPSSGPEGLGGLNGAACRAREELREERLRREVLLLRSIKHPHVRDTTTRAAPEQANTKTMIGPAR